MKKLLFAHFLKDTLFFFLLISLSLGLIVWVIQAVNYLDFITEDGHSFRVYISYTLFNFPKIIHRILPFIFFVSLFYQINRYELKNELSESQEEVKNKVSDLNEVQQELSQMKLQLALEYPKEYKLLIKNLIDLA